MFARCLFHVSNLLKLTWQARERMNYLLRPEIGAFARDLKKNIFGGGLNGDPATATAFEIYTLCYNVLSAWRAPPKSRTSSA